MYYPESRKLTKDQLIDILQGFALTCLKSDKELVIAQGADFLQMIEDLKADKISLLSVQKLVDQIRYASEERLQALRINDAPNRDESNFDDGSRIPHSEG